MRTEYNQNVSVLVGITTPQEFWAAWVISGIRPVTQQNCSPKLLKKADFYILHLDMNPHVHRKYPFV